MIGGTVTETVIVGDRLWVGCEEDTSTSKCGIYVERNQKSERIKPGDCIWWQGGFAMWTPYDNRGKSQEEAQSLGFKCGKDYDIKIPRIGFSGVSRPQQTS
jgi:hypothetical protein